MTYSQFHSLPNYFWVPNRTLDSEVKRAFGHFHQGRGPVSVSMGVIAGDQRVVGGQGGGKGKWGRSFSYNDPPLTHLKRLSWHHPGGSDLLRCSGFYTASDPNKEDIR